MMVEDQYRGKILINSRRIIYIQLKILNLVFPMNPNEMLYFNRYIIEKKEKLGTRWVKAGKTAGPDCNFRVTDVIEGTEVQFQVRAENEAGVGHPSEPTELLSIEDPKGKVVSIIQKILSRA